MVVYVLWCVLCKVRVEIERGWKMSFLSRSGFSFTYHFLVFCSFWILILYKGMTTVWIIPKNHLQVRSPEGSYIPADLLGTKDDLLRYSVPSWEVLRSPFGHLSALRSTEFLMGWGGGNENSCTAFWSTTTVLRKKIFRYRWVFTIMYVDHFYWRVQTFEGIWVLPRLC